MADKDRKTFADYFDSSNTKTVAGKKEATLRLVEEVSEYKGNKLRIEGGRKRLATMLASEEWGGLTEELLEKFGLSRDEIVPPAPPKGPTKAKTVAVDLFGDLDPNLVPEKGLKIKTAAEKPDAEEELHKRLERIARGELSKSAGEKLRQRKKDMEKLVEAQLMDQEKLEEGLKKVEEQLLEAERKTIEKQLEDMGKKKSEAGPSKRKRTD